MKNHTLLSVILLLFLWACQSSKNSDESKASSTPMDVRNLEKIQPKDAGLAEKYNRSCFLCHANPDAKAHLVGDKATWDRLLKEKGMPLLLAHVNEGFNTMPPKGQCADCSDADFEALIKFMAGLE